MDTINWGILSTANIGVDLVIPAMQQSGYGRVKAISSRNKEKAEAVASKLDIEKVHGSYEDLLADDDIDAIYNPLPNHLHLEWTLKTMEAGKHVLCEKPIGMDAAEAKKLMEAAKKYPELKVMEAFMYRFHPQWDMVKKWISDGVLGTVKTVHSVFTYYNDDPENIRNKSGIGGGGLMDIGCYCISASRYLLETEPEKVSGEIELDPDFGVDRLTSGMLRFPNATATFTCSTQASPSQQLMVFGEEGIIQMETAFNPLENETGIYLLKDGEVQQEHRLQANHYTLQADAFAKAILNDKPVPTPLSDALANMKVIDAIFESSRTEKPVYL